MDLDIVDDITAVAADDFDRLDPSAGATGSYARTRQRAADGRWRSRYLRCTDRDRLTALVPLYTSRARDWPDAAYDPRTWGVAPGGPANRAARTTAAAAGRAVERDVDRAAEWAVDRCLVVGGTADLRTSLPVERELRGVDTLRSLLVPIARLAAEEGRGLVFPYVTGDVRRALTGATKGRAVWAELGREANLRGVSDAGWESALGKRARYNVRHDRALIDAAGVRRGEHRWAEVEDRACELIAGHSLRKGRFDHPDFVRLRGREWDRCAPVELVVFTASAGDVEGVVTVLAWRDNLTVLEIGLLGGTAPERLAVYLDLAFHHPLDFARARGIADIRLGATSEGTKAGRGAVFETLCGGVLDVDDTEFLAADR